MLVRTKVTQLFLGSIVMASTLIACKSGEQKTEEVVTNVTKDTTVIASSNGKMGSAIVKIDSSVLTKTITTKKLGIAKPNPAKKGGKGKVIIESNAAVVKPLSNATKVMDNEGYYDRVDVLPSYPGGDKALAKFVEKNITYPQEAINDGVEGTVNVMFAVDENGTVYTPSTKGEALGYGLDEAAANVVRKMPRWNPGSIKGKNVKTRFTLPITFQIN
ncbi:energy transducer TonB [Parasediminibacterium paludis]|uniref:Energy transducer TonB n=1 Tax=Parasediminibacterium paludis TaxID=908966 RepID=A0ABV8PYJ2_9BACT